MHELMARLQELRIDDFEKSKLGVTKSMATSCVFAEGLQEPVLETPTKKRRRTDEPGTAVAE